jgi:hypothetical protein
MRTCNQNVGAKFMGRFATCEHRAMEFVPTPGNLSNGIASDVGVSAQEQLLCLRTVFCEVYVIGKHPSPY